MGYVGQSAIRNTMKCHFACLAALVFCACVHAISAEADITVQIGKNFTGATLGIDSDFIPPDTDGAIGPSNYVELINGRFSVFDKNTMSNVLTMTAVQFF